MKYLLRLVVVILMLGSAYAQSNLPACTSSSGYFHNCFGTFTLDNGDQYDGEWKDGKQNGQGTYLFLANDEHKGDKYVGEYKDNKRTGQGTYTFANGNQYVGEWKDGKQNGQGTFYYLGKTGRQGIWANGAFIRSGVQQATVPVPVPVPVCQGSDASRWSYCFGSYTYAAGHKYVGVWKDGKRNGQATFTLSSGSKYVGEWKDDKLNGQFNVTYASGNKYVGELKDGEINGRGTAFSTDGSIIAQGIWADGELVRSEPVQQATASNGENERLKAEAAEAKRKQAEAADSIRVAHQLASQEVVRRI